jgi:hypothetical protein
MLRKVRPDAQIFIFDPTLDQTGNAHSGGGKFAQDIARKSGYHFIPMGLAYRKGTLRLGDNAGLNTIGKGNIRGAHKWDYDPFRGDGAFRELFTAYRPSRVIFTAPVKTLDVLMLENNHTHIDILKVR